MKEKELLGAIVNLGRLYGWRVAHFASVETLIPNGGGRTRWMTPVRADGKGFPDLILVRDRVVAAEVKGGGHRPTPQQREWLDAFRVAGCDAYVWTPADWDDGTVAARLRSRTPEAVAS